MRKQYLYLIMLFFSLSSSAQTVLLDIDTKEQQRKIDFGPNLKRFTHLTFHIGALASKDRQGARIIYGSSINLSLGIRKKFKISPAYSLGYDLEWQFTDYKFKQKQGKIFPDTIINNVSQRLDYAYLSLGFYNRFNLDPSRGNFLGTFLDLGINGNFNYAVKKISKNELEKNVRSKSVLSNMPFVNTFNSNFYARFGRSHISFFCSYRLIELFKQSYNYPDLPRLILGIDTALF
jgi:hypothetical protein